MLTVPTTTKNCIAYARYVQQRKNANKRGIAFQMSFAVWEWLWLDSGKWSERGPLPHQYCMSRHGDEGPYAVANVTIKTVRENLDELACTEARKAQVRKALTGREKTPEHRAAIGAANRARGTPPPLRNKPVWVEGTLYPSMGSACEARGVTMFKIRYRIKQGFPGYRYAAKGDM